MNALIIFCCFVILLHLIQGSPLLSLLDEDLISSYLRAKREILRAPTYRENKNASYCELFARSDCPKPPICPPFEEYQYSDVEDECEATLKEFTQARIQNHKCVCKKGYKRINGVCKEASSCIECKPNEYYTEDGPSTIETCTNYLQIKEDVTNNVTGCFCVDDYRYDEVLKRCVRIEDCTQDPTCPENQIYSKTGATAAFCKGMGVDRTTTLEDPGCYCKEGYVLQSEEGDRCIPEEKCVCDENQIVADLFPCEDTCDSRYSHDCTNTSNKCVCMLDYVREDVNSTNCIPMEDCPNPPICGVNETFTKTGYKFCPSESQSASSNVMESCHCKDGYLRDDSVENGRCVLEKDCPPVDCGPNQEYKKSGYMKKCKEDNVSLSGPGCYCKPGFVFKMVNEYDTECVPIGSCPVCGENQEISEFSACQITCQDLLEDNSGSDCPLPTFNICVCRTGYVWESVDSNKCIPLESCSFLCQENEVFAEFNSKADDCWHHMHKEETYHVGTAGCYCAEGYARTPTDLKCVPIQNCSLCNDNEENIYENLDAEEKTCEDWAILENTFEDFGARPESEEDDEPDCLCKSGFVRDSVSKICVPKEECPSKPPPCGPNQIFQTASQTETSCDDPTPELRDGPFCFCQSGYVRNYKNDCVPPKECPNCPKENTDVSLCVHCYDFCNGTRECSWDCLGDCDCIPGYVWKDDGTCVPIDTCPSIIIKPLPPSS